MRTIVIIATLIASALAIWWWWDANDDPEQKTVDRTATYWEPEFVLGAMQPAQDGVVAKIGGLPWGFPQSRWPSCRECGRGLSHLAQLPHHDRIFDLGKAGSVLHLFHCEWDGICSTWDDSTGASHWEIIDKTDLSAGLTSPPVEARLLGEYRITGWQEGKTPAQFLANLDSWYDQDRFFKLEDGIFEGMIKIDTKAGGIPYWTGNGPNSFPDPPYEYLAQFDTFMHCSGPIPTPDQADTTVRYNGAGEGGDDVYVDPEKKRGTANHLIQVERDPDRFYGDWANLGSDGTGFLFINREIDPVDIVWFWNR